jgi:hypothetical protein
MGPMSTSEVASSDYPPEARQRDVRGTSRKNFDDWALSAYRMCFPEFGGENAEFSCRDACTMCIR